MTTGKVHPRPRPARVYRLLVEYPEGSEDPGWVPEAWRETEDRPTFRWPRVRDYLSEEGAHTRAAMLREYGAKVEVIASDPVRWTAAYARPGGPCPDCPTLMPCVLHPTGEAAL